MIAQSAIPEILYHGVLVKTPATSVRQAVVVFLARNYGPFYPLRERHVLPAYSRPGNVCER